MVLLMLSFDGQMIECGGFPANIGSLCHVETDDDTPAVAELIGFQNGNNLLSLHQFGARIRVGARVTLADDGATIPVGDALLGRITEAGRSEQTLPREWGDYFTLTRMPAVRIGDFNMSTVSPAS